jgi:hypothetical protein
MRKPVYKFEAKPFINHIGQTINPGDQVIFVVTTKWTSNPLKKGIFAGVFLGEERRYDNIHGDYITKTVVKGTRITDVPHYSYKDDNNLIKEVKRTSVTQLNYVYKVDTLLENLNFDLDLD